uniref:Phosphate transporter n=1 Tax=Rhizophora mucronata TaxID=61149 RepID=A0A2P2Q667_RHIMU
MGDLTYHGCISVISGLQMHQKVCVQCSKSRTSSSSSSPTCCLCGFIRNLFCGLSSEQDTSFGSGTGHSLWCCWCISRL